MEGSIYIADKLLGNVDFKIIDESMGGIGGYLTPEPAYQNYQKRIQQLYAEKGIANVEDIDLRIVLENGAILDPEGGIGITDSVDDDEIYVEATGVDLGSLNIST